MKKTNLKIRKYIAGLMLVLLVISAIGLLKVGKFDKLAGKVKVKEAHLSNVSTKLKSNIYDALGDNAVTSNGYDKIDYELTYKVSEEGRDVIIIGTLNDDERFASFKRVTGENITCSLSNNDRRIEIVISNAPKDEEISTNVSLLINGAPNGYIVNPRFQIKESTGETFNDIYTNPIEVSTNSLRGVVRNQDNEGIENIIVSLYKNRELIKETYTDNSGNYIFSDLDNDSYTIKINEEIYKNVSIDNVRVSGDSSIDLITERIYPFNMEVHKYITKVDAYNVGNLISRSYSNASTVNFPIEKLQNLSGKVYYKIVVENTGEKEGVVSLVKDELPEFMSFDEKENSGFELKDGIIYDRNLEGVTLDPGQKIEDVLVLNIIDTKEAKTYLNKVTADGEIYEHVVYLLDNQTYKEEDVLEGELTTRPTDPVENFSGWYTDSKYTNKYNFNNPVTKNLVLYGKTAQKYRVEFYDKDPETGDETPYDEQEVNGGEPVTKPDPDPTHTGYTFKHWCTVDNTEYIFTTPVNSDLKLITCYKINEYDVNFYNYQDTKEKNIKVEYKHLIDQDEAPTFDETGYTFLCWSENKSDCFDFTTPITKDVDLYPTHERLNNAVVFDDENRVTTVEVPYGDTVEPIADQGKTGHSFRCWSEDRENCFDFTTPIIQNTTVYAIYDINKFTVHFIDVNPETSEQEQYGEDQIVDYGNTATRPDPNPSHTGYTFNEWKNGENTYNFETPVTSDITLVSSYNINSYPVRFHNDNDVTTVNVEYKHKVTPITSPTKDHHIFTNWVKNDESIFDFDTLIVEEIDLYSSFEEVLSPSISHAPTMWTNSSVTVTVSKNDNLSDDTGYTYKYKTSDGEYNDYTEPFTVSENTTIVAKSFKQEVDSVVSNHEIVNIDKLNPSITEFSENTANRTSITLNVSVLDNESGVNYYEIYQDNVKVGEKHLECYNETTFDGYETCRENLPAERETTYTVTGLTQSTTYTFKIKAYDKAGNFVTSDDLEVTTTEPVIIARLIGYNNQLFEDTIDEDTGEVITPKEDKYINFESLEEAFDYEDLYDCKNVQCTIQMVRSTNESVEVLEGQDLTLDLNGKIVSGISEDYTIKNNGEFTLIDSVPETEDSGKLINNSGIAILNKAGASLTLGEGYSDREVSSSIVSTTRPYVYGSKNGVKNETNGNFAFFDGKIVSISSNTPGFGAINGQVTGTEYSYEAKSNTSTIDDVEYQIITLNQIVDPEARINKSVYFAKLNTAIDSASKGSSIIESETGDLMEGLEPADDTYYFEYDENSGTWISNNDQQATIAKSTITINLLDAEYDKNLSIEYLINAASNGQKGNASVTISTYDNHGKTISGNVQPTYYPEGAYRWLLQKGKVYVLNISYTQPSINQTEDDEEVTLGNMVINNIYYSDYVVSQTENALVQDNVSVFTEGFYYDEETNTLRSNTQYLCDGKPSAAYSQQEIDLTDKEGDYELIVNASVETQIGNNYEAFIIVDTNPSYEYYSSYPLFRMYGSSTQDPVDTIVNGMPFAVYGPDTTRIKLTGGNKYYIKFLLRKYSSNQCATKEEYEQANISDQMIIHSINLVKLSSESNTIDSTELEVKHNYLNEFVSNSKGTFNLNSDESKASTDNLTSNQASTSYLNIDLTDDEYGGIFAVKYNSTASSDGTKPSPTVLMNYIYEQDGTQTTISVYNTSVTNEDGSVTLYYSLRGGGKYRFDLSYASQSLSDLEYYSNLVIDNISYNKLANFEGNNLNGIYNYNNLYALSTNSYCQAGKYLDSYIKLDLTNYDKDQLLSLPYFMYTTGNTRAFVYLTNNNRALSLEDAISNRNNMIMYMYDNYKYPSYRNGNSFYPSSNYGNYSNYQRDIVLEKGEIYYLHFANHNNDTYICSPGPNYNYSGNGSIDLYDISLTPIDEELIMYGNNTIFTGTEDYADKSEESSTITLNQNSFDNLDFQTGVKVYDYLYNEETGYYEPQNTEAMSAAVTKIKFDLTESTTDKNYVIYNYNGAEGSRLITISENEEDLTPINFNTMIGSGTPSGYDYMSKFTLQKGKVYYVQVVSYLYSASDNNPTQGSFKIEEYKFENETSDYETFNEIRHFNEKVDTVQLLKDVIVSDKPVSIDYNQEVILDLNGHTLSTTNQNYTIDNSGDLTITNSADEEVISKYNADLAEYEEYAGLCSGCEPSEEYILDQKLRSKYDFTGSEKEFVAPYTGDYKLEVWGAQGGSYNDTYLGGYGGYSKGKIHLEKGDTLYINVGGQGVKSTKSAQSFAGGYNGGGNAYGYTDKFVGSGGGATHIATASGLLSSLSENQNSVLIVAGGGGGAGYSSNSYNGKGGAGGGYIANNGTTSRNITTGKGGTQTEGGTGLDGANVANSGSFGQGANSTNNGTGGGGGWYGGGGGKWDAAGGGGSGYIGNELLTDKKMVMYTTDDTRISDDEATRTEITTSHSSTPRSDYAKEGNGYAVISFIDEEKIQELRDELDKTYNVKEEPSSPIVQVGSISSSKSSGAVINNQEKAILTIKSGVYTTTGTGSTVIKNSGDLILDGPVEIKVNNTNGTGINNLDGGTITRNGGKAKITINVSSCSNTNVTSRGILLNSGDVDFTNIDISGKNGVAIQNNGANLKLHASNINMTDTCSTTTYNNNSDTTATSEYNKNFSYVYKSYSSVKKYDGALYQNGGTTIIDKGTSLSGTINAHIGDLKLTDGTTFNDFYQDGGTATINNVDVSLNKVLYNDGGVLNIGAPESSNYKLNASNIINFGTMNTYSGLISSVYNLGTINTHNTDFSKLYNLNTYIDRNPSSGNYSSTNPLSLYKGVANLNGGTIRDNILVNESNMTIDGTTITSGVINRKDLIVKGNSNITADNRVPILNEPFTFSYEYTSIGSTRIDDPRYVAIPVTLTIGENNEIIDNNLTIKATGSTDAITGDCYAKKIGRYNSKVYKNWIDEDLHFYKYAKNIYRVSNNFTTGGIADMDDYYIDNTLCDLYYYDGTVSTNRGGPINTVTDIAITDMPEGQDVFVANDATGAKMSLLPINSDQRPDAFEVNGINTKSLQAAINLVPDNTPTTINVLSSGNFTTASPVTIPENKEITISGTGSTGYIHSKDSFITNNGTLDLKLSVFTRGQTIVKNNNILNVSAGSYQGHFDYFDYFFREANFVKNYGTTFMSGSYTSNLDYRDYGTFTLNGGGNDSNGTIYSYGSTVTLNNPYLSFTAGDNYNRITYFRDKTGKEILNNWFNSKPGFITKTNDEGVGSTIYINDMSYSNFYLGEFNNATVNINNVNNYSNGYWLANALLNNSTLNLNNGSFNAGSGALRISGTYNQNAGNVSGGITLADDTIANVKSGSITTTGDSLAVFNLGKNDVISLGTKGTGTASKTNPALTCGNYCFDNVDASDTLNIYDGILKANTNPINITINEIEDGFALIYNRKSNPKEAYLEDLSTIPIIHNYTTKIDYYDIQLAFDEANTDDELILVRDVANGGDSPSIVIANDKKFKLYLNYILDFDNNGNKTYTPYKEGDTVTDINSIETPIISINNADIVDAETGDITEVPFIINNGNVTIYGSSLNDIPSNENEKTANFENNSGARIISNNGTLNLYEISAVSEKAIGVMFKNNSTGTMNIRRSKFETNANTIFDNSGTINMIASSGDTSTCYNPTIIKIINTFDNSFKNLYSPLYRYSNQLTDDYQRYINNPIKEPIINSGTFSINNLYIDTDYAFNIVQNTGTMSLNNVSIEQFNNDKYGNNTTAISSYDGRPSYEAIINMGTLSLNNVTSFMPGSIYNDNILNISDSQLNTIETVINNNSGKVTINDSELNSAGIGIYNKSNNETIINNTDINANSSVWMSRSNQGTLDINGGTYISNADNNNISYFKIKTNNMNYSCDNNTPVTNYISGNFKRTDENYYKYYYVYGTEYTNHIFPGFDAFHLGNSEATIKNATIKYSNTNVVPKTPSSFTQQKYYYNEHGLITSYDSKVTIEDSTINLNQTTNEYGNKVDGIIVNNSDLDIINSEVTTVHNKSIDKTINVGKKDTANDAKPEIERIRCSSDNTKGINLYDGYVYIDDSYLCKFNDKETDYNIVGDNDNKRYLSQDNFIKNINLDTPYNSLSEALSNASNGDTLQLLKDISLLENETEYTLDNKQITLDLNRFDINADMTLVNGANLTITDSAYITDSSVGRGSIKSITNTSGTLTINEGYVKTVDNSSTITMTSGKIDTLNTTSGTVTGGTITTVNNTGNLNVSNTTITTFNSSSSGVVSLDTVTIQSINNKDNSKITLKDTNVTGTLTNSDSAEIILNGGNTIYNFTNSSSVPMTFDNSTITTLRNILDEMTLNGATVSTVFNTGPLTINSGSIGYVYNAADATMTINGGNINYIYNRHIFKQSNGSIQTDHEYDQNLKSVQVGYNHIEFPNTILNVTGGTIGTITNKSIANITGGTITSISNGVEYYKGTLTLGSKDGIVSTSSPVIRNTSGYAITAASRYSVINYYDGILTGSSATRILSGEITSMETNYVPNVGPDYDEHGDLTGTYSMVLKPYADVDVKIACVNGVCYGSLQAAINASVNNYTEEGGCPNVVVGDDVYFALELDADLVLDPQYSLTIDLNHHNINDNGFDIPSNITLINGSRNGSDLQSSLARFLSNVFGTNDTTKDIIITKMEDGNALDTAKTYKLYKLENEAYLPIKVDSDGAGKYSLGKETTDMKSIKGRIYLNNVDAGEYMLKDNLDNELEFTIYDDGSLSPNIRENIISDYGHMSASAVATLIISIQTGILRVGNILIALAVIILIIIILLLYKKKSINKKETI